MRDIAVVSDRNCAAVVLGVRVAWTYSVVSLEVGGFTTDQPSSATTHSAVSASMSSSWRAGKVTVEGGLCAM